MRKQDQTGWPAILISIICFAGVFAAWLFISGELWEPFYQERRIWVWVAAALIGFCILAELSCLKCPHCRSRSVVLVLVEETDRWMGLKAVDENSLTLGLFQIGGRPGMRGTTESLSVARRIVPVTKRRLLRRYRCDGCGEPFEREVVEDMT